jgi:hypothetical protein
MGAQTTPGESRVSRRAGLTGPEVGRYAHAFPRAYPATRQPMEPV